MKLRCKSCQKKIKLADYKCPFCGTVNFSTDEEVRAAYNARVPKHMPGKIGAAAAGAFAAVSSAVVVFIIIILVIIGAIIISVYSIQKADNEWAFEHVLQQTDFENANSGFGNRFELTRVYSESAYPYYVMYMTYNGKPENFINESVSFCDMLYHSYVCYDNRYNHRDDLAFKLTCGEMMFICDRSRYVETNVLFDYSTLECFDLKSLTVHTGEMSDTDIKSIENGNYSFDIYLK